eukprot:Lithocolla_globosa_v1_NODE_2966_length_1810_cov_16.806838.p1 type:complete len:265 gc:universal NODE_2966_length_1810_cov_16.806838:807-13(-)
MLRSGIRFLSTNSFVLQRRFLTSVPDNLGKLVNDKWNWLESDEKRKEYDRTLTIDEIHSFFAYRRDFLKSPIPTSYSAKLLLRHWMGFYSDRNVNSRRGAIIFTHCSQPAQTQLDFFFETCRLPYSVTSFFGITMAHLYLCISRLRSMENTRMMEGAMLDSMAHQMSVRSFLLGRRKPDKGTRQWINIYYGALIAYDFAFHTGDAELAKCINKNMCMEQANPEVLALLVQYFRQCSSHLATVNDWDFLHSVYEFPEPSNQLPKI